MSISLIRTLILYCVVITALRLMGKRQIGELSPNELVITILISQLATIPMEDMSIPLFSGLVPMLTLVSVEIITSYLCLKNRKLRFLFNGRPAVIIRSGKLDRQKMHDLRLTTDEVLEALRQNNIASPAELEYAVIETSGVLSYVLKPDNKPVTASMLNLSPPECGLPLIVISDGKIVQGNLDRLNITEKDILKRLKGQQITSVKDVFLMTLDDCGNQFIQRKEKKK